MASSRTGTAKWLKLAKQARARALEQGKTRCPIRGCGLAMDWEYSGRPNSAEVDHITPHSKGGQDDLDNLRVICRACNQRMGGQLNRRKPRAPVTTTELDASPIW